MKITILFSLMLFILGSQDMISQETENNRSCTPGSTEYTTRYIKAKAMYVKMQNAESTKVYMDLIHQFSEKAHYGGDRSKIIKESSNGENVLHYWVFNNIEKTDFKDCEEVEAEIVKILEANSKVIEENKELYIYMAESSRLCPDFSSNLLLELMREYGRNLRL